ncbi:PAS domain S-box-containing protein [Oceanospirillum multiglobuliferum]|uniref:histidine kinase n=1 Tax=Oceanospirillum multiglobuliferum TaxID=64969 RepID=A0A1T4S051_9GAMM|nr:PAS domain S-box protein [Oceanospirillum multiglobuliferum]OPX54536.1 hypothetical protein BTE48_13680 [Oceanospirillum multiglobuliferum]SKA21623.1 PAS domain S-box-containing protein [Oceanospirillum multiglobuliferum]
MIPISEQAFAEQLYALGFTHTETASLVQASMGLIARHWQARTLCLYHLSGRCVYASEHAQDLSEQLPELLADKPKELSSYKVGELHCVPLNLGYILISDSTPEPELSRHWCEIFVHKLATNTTEKRSDVQSRTQTVISNAQIMQLVMDNIPTRVFWKNTQLEYVGANQAFLQDVGIESLDQLQGLTLSQMPWAEDNRVQLTQQDLQLLAGDVQSIDYEESLTIGKKVLWVQGHKIAIRDNEGKTTGILGTYHDITTRKNDEEKLRLLATAFESHEGIVIANYDGIILEMNAAFCEITGYQPEEIVGKTFRVLHSGRQNQQFYLAMWASIHERGRWEGEIWNKRKNGEIYPEWVTITAVKNDEGATTHYVAAFIDLTEIKTQQAEIRRAALQDQLISQLFHLTLQSSSTKHYLQRTLEILLESLPWLMPIASVHIAPNDKSPSWQLMAELNFSGTSDLSNHADLLSRLRALESKPQAQHLNSCQHCSGVQPHSHYLLPLLLDSQLVGALTVCLRAFDVQNKQDDEQLKRICNVLALGVSRRQTEQALILAKEDAEHANLAKSQFLSSMSHELRTPLNAILGFSQLLELEELDDEQQESVSEITQAGLHLLELINEVLDLAKIEAGRIDLKIESFSVDMVLRDCLSLSQPLAAKRQVQIECDLAQAENFLVKADRTRLKQILLNLISNAIKYGKEAGTIRILFSNPEYGRVRIAVQDDGEGISAEYQKELFQPFHRLGAEASHIEGTGIGLVISRKLAENMNSELNFTSQLGQGSTFWIDLPQAFDTTSIGTDLDEDDDFLYEQTSVSPKLSTILYIEDNKTNQKLIEQALHHRTNVKLLCAGTALHGLELASGEQPELILLDMGLPDMNGFELLELLKCSSETANIPVIALTADAMPEVIEKAIAAGFSEYMTKPIDVQVFLRCIDQWLA